MKHYYFLNVTDWVANDTGLNHKIVWYKYGGLKRGELRFKILDDELEVHKFLCSAAFQNYKEVNKALQNM